MMPMAGEDTIAPFVTKGGHREAPVAVLRPYILPSDEPTKRPPLSSRQGEDFTAPPVARRHLTSTAGPGGPRYGLAPVRWPFWPNCGQGADLDGDTDWVIDGVADTLGVLVMDAVALHVAVSVGVDVEDGVGVVDTGTNAATAGRSRASASAKVVLIGICTRMLEIGDGQAPGQLTCGEANSSLGKQQQFKGEQGARGLRCGVFACNKRKCNCCARNYDQRVEAASGGPPRGSS